MTSREQLIMEFRRDAEEKRGVSIDFISVRTCERNANSYDDNTVGSGLKEIVARLMDGRDHQDLIRFLINNAHLLRENYDTIMTVIGNVNSLLSNGSVESLKTFFLTLAKKQQNDVL
ncbi:hypothetical protein AsGV152 [Agrotis segetum granulovirus]|uniref:Uncharacterized protein n=1 Tax=Agrotis segetum granulosis virus TaxID=10464 RepID=A0A023MIJ9_GVAS|nr:hypothetical protein AsGV152 [Agrotis segetum granulovirus]AHN92188.1 hypothetical protein AsGV149 [Agrotis segetum granulovirus]AKN63426.1 hypothetical protein AsGV152 [Agrotis segetum granulovirus]